MITVFTDGGCDPNPGVGGWAFVVVDGTAIIYEEWGGSPETTNNIMELTAICKAMVWLDGKPAKIISDSQYCVKGMNIWRFSWKKRGWVRGKQGVLANADLWRVMDALALEKPYSFEWVRGHNGNKYNEHADYLAGLGIQENTLADPIEEQLRYAV